MSSNVLAGSFIQISKGQGGVLTLSVTGIPDGTNDTFYGVTAFNDDINVSGDVTAWTGYVPTNTASFNILTNDLALDTWYTNANQRAAVVFSLEHDPNTTGVSSASLMIDQDKDGTWDTVIKSQKSLLTDNQIEVVSGWLQPSARFAITNLSSGGGAVSVLAGSCQLVRQ